MYISNDAAIDFYVISTTSLQFKLINDLEYTKRLTSLREMLDPRSKMLKSLIMSKLVESITLEEKEIFKGNKENSEHDLRYSNEGSLNSSNENTEYEDIEPNSDSDIYSFTTKEKGVHDTKWRFFEGDVDHTPSIPHGHSIEVHAVVLNPYTREVFPQNDRKEDKKLINRLWNNKKFRETAWKNLELHLSNLEHIDTALRYKELLINKCKSVKHR
ncbi:hypothetical protein CN996_19230 [Bacillus cereus]|uniref:hypothetical protein n=1 Tax=Bacillus wiedmannii TaxID=1890302 RepID=UPI000BF413C6|nr:hypothetical protein [Bacillus wiedmannii]PFI36188.1 hypothetical protein COI72_19800 [Bacillus cereus]PFX60230.1 hypothetical protein COL36_13160 [Bacillus wiedmannii]PGL39046.1 hypothetical protein CN930_11960 [Bacillus cereus]PGP00897.1 hypothetical protein CN996_19230 [Bacillus cereus]